MDDSYVSGPEPTPEPTPEPAPEPAPAQSNTNWGMLAHLSGVVGLFISAGIVSIAGPLIIMLTVGKDDAWTRREAVEALNFNISFLVYLTVSGALTVILIGFVLAPTVFIAYAVLSILATISASKRTSYRYPLIFRLVH